MIDEAHIKKLATLSRISITEEEGRALAQDIESILSYVDEIQELDVENAPEVGSLYNVMRDDGEPHKEGLYSEALLREAPSVEKGYIAVKKIIDQS